VIYFYGEAAIYYPQFYEPYVHYLAPFFAIPGNHDGDLPYPPADPSVASLEAFVANSCAQSSQPEARDSGEVSRPPMTQPNVYWTLDTPLATFVGFYSNVPEGGQFQPDQLSWFVSELKNAPSNKALIVSAHRPALSADAHHGGSQYMLNTFDASFQKA
jgi:3',5'-cyclic AMP phosphodiesterase CpdA